MPSNFKKTKSLKINVIFNAFYQILILLAPLLTTPYISRVLGPEVIGDYSYYYSILGYFTLIATFGFNDYGTKAIAECRDDPEKRSDVFWGIQTAKFLLSLLCLGIYFITFFALFSNNQTAIYIFLGMSLYIVSIMFDPTFFFQGNEDFVSISIRNAFVRILTIILTFVFVRSENDVIKYALVLSIGNLLATAIMFFSFRRGDIKKPTSFKNLQLVRHYKAALAYFIPGLAVTLFTSLNQTMLGAMSTSSESGYYGQSSKIITLLSTFAGSLSIIMFSRMSFLFSKGDSIEIKQKTGRTFEAFWAVALPLMFGIVSITPTLVPLFFGPGYEKIIPNIFILSLVIILSPLNGLLGNLYFRPQNKIWIQTAVIIFASCVNILASYFLIAKFQSIGASIGRLIAEIVQLPLLLLFARKGISKSIVFKPFIKPFDNSLIMFIIVFTVSSVLENYLSSITLLCIELFTGIVVYLILEIITKETFGFGIMNLVARKLKSFVKKKNNKILIRFNKKNHK